MENKNVTFSYTYSAKQNDEVRKIREKYLPTKESKLEQLRRLDHGVTQKATIKAWFVGIVGVLIFEFGMSISMTALNDLLGDYCGLGKGIGVIIGIAGLILLISVFWIYQKTVRKEQQKIAPEIIRLCDELMKGD